MDIIQSIKKDHKEVRQMFDKLVDSKSKSDFLALRQELIPHMKAEESVFYPLLMDGDSREDTLEGYEEHHASELVLKELEKTRIQDERWSAKLKVLKEMIDHHIKEEESKILKSAQSELKKSELQELSEKFESTKSELRKKL
jgi:hypothetical protein